MLAVAHMDWDAARSESSGQRATLWPSLTPELPDQSPLNWLHFPSQTALPIPITAQCLHTAEHSGELKTDQAETGWDQTLEQRH